MPAFLEVVWLWRWLFSWSWWKRVIGRTCLDDTVQAELAVRQSDAGSVPLPPRAAGGAGPPVEPDDRQVAPVGASGVPGARRPASSRWKGFPAARSTLLCWPPVVRPG